MNSHSPPLSTAMPAPFPWRHLLHYGLMIAATVGLFLLIRGRGETLAAPELEGAVGHASAKESFPLFAHLLLALAAVIAVGWGLGRLLAYVGQPPVIGEVLAGILLGPSFLGWLSPAAMEFVLPAQVAPFLGVIAQLGVVLYMFLVGLELNPGLLQARTTVAISHASIVVPFLLGTVLALWLYPILSHRGVPFTSFALFMGVALSITAFPVLARILTDRGIARTELGVLALGCAAIDDVTAWWLLALMVGVAQARTGGVLLLVGWTLAFILFLFLVVRPLAARSVGRLKEDEIGKGTVAAVLIAVLLAALTTEAIGIHAIFGAFLLGAVIPHDSALARDVRRKLEDVVTVLLLPAFFAYTGMRTRIGLVSGLEEWRICGLITLVSAAGKFGGTVAAARLTGLDWRMSASLGVLMNTRGLMELIVLNVGLDLGVISPTLFAMMVLMALADTLATTPLLQVLNPSMCPHSPTREREVVRPYH